jgi:hypothetical protein
MGKRLAQKLCRAVLLAVVCCWAGVELLGDRSVPQSAVEDHTAARSHDASLLPDPRNRSAERGWPCMRRFASMQQRHAFTQASWVTPAPDERSWLQRWLRPAAHTAPQVLATRRAGDTRPTVIIAGIAKDIEPQHFRFAIPKLLQLGEAAFADYHMIVYENDSPADSRGALCEELARADSKASFLFEDIVQNAGSSRVKNIARARNVVMDWVQQHTSGFEYLLWTDLDGVCGGTDTDRSYDPRVLQRAFDRSDEWEAVSFVFYPYWDMWAFREQNVHPFDQYGANKRRNKVKDINALAKWIQRQPPAQLIPVESAFMMLAIYKLSSIGECRYSTRDRAGAAACEHVPFHECIQRKRGARLRIWPEAYCVGDPGWPFANESNATAASAAAAAAAAAAA